MPKTTRAAEATWHEKYQRWQVNVQKDGARRSFYSSNPSKRGKSEAEKKADAWLEHGTEKDVRYEIAWKEYLEHVKATTKSESYIKAESIGRTWLTGFDKRRVSMIAPGDFQEKIEAAGTAGRSKRTCGNIRAQVIAFYKFCRSKRYPLEDPRPIDVPTNAPVGKRKILQPNAVKVLFTDDTIIRYGKTKHDFFIHAYRFLFLIVLRRGEECGIKDENIKDGVLHLCRAINRLGEETEGKNKNAIRDIVLPPTAIAVIEAQKAMLKKLGVISPWLFPDEHGNRLDSNHLYKMWRRYREQHGMLSNLHEIRHSAISALKSDLPLALMKPRIGHSLTMDTLGTYGHEVDGDAQRTADIMEEVYRRMIK